MPRRANSRKAVVQQQIRVQVIASVDAAEASGSISEWSHVDLPEALLQSEPQRGGIVSEVALEALGATELTLSNSMRVSFRCSELMDDQVLMSVRLM
jgi:hypothetical protein